MFEAIILLALLGLVLWFILSKEKTTSARKACFVDLTAESKPPTPNATKRRV